MQGTIGSCFFEYLLYADVVASVLLAAGHVMNKSYLYFARPHLRFSDALFCPVAALRKQ